MGRASIRRRAVRPLIGLALAAVFALGACGGDEPTEVVLVGAGDIGAGAFTSPVAEAPTRSLADFGADAPDTTVPDDAIAVTVRSGDEPGLYAGSEDDEACDRTLLAERLTGAPTVATAWAAVVGVEADQVATTIEAATGVETTVDLRVTSHRWVDGDVVADHAVLAAGTAVLVRADGTPLARCLSGAPLLPAAAISGAITFSGTAWPGFAADRLSTVRPAEAPAAALELVDPDTGGRVVRPVG
ncbi:MAG: DUF6777 domain-containing protein [Acidimicrobiales bacterium]